MGRRWPVPYKRAVLEYAQAVGRDAKYYRSFEVPKTSYYIWKRAYRKEGLSGLIPKKPVPKSHPRALPVAVVERIVDLRKTSHLGPQRIAWYLARHDGIQTSCSSVYRTLVNQGFSCLPKKVGRRAVHTHRYAKQVPGHHIQVDVKFVSLKSGDGHRVRRFQYTAIDDATRIRALKIYPDKIRTMPLLS